MKKFNSRNFINHRAFGYFHVREISKFHELAKVILSFYFDILSFSL